MPNPLRIPAWLLGLTVVVIPGALVRVIEIRGAAGIPGFVAILLPLALFGVGAVRMDALEARGQLGTRPCPGSKHRRGLFLAILIATNCYCALILMLGGRVIARFGI